MYYVILSQNSKLLQFKCIKLREEKKLFSSSFDEKIFNVIGKAALVHIMCRLFQIAF